MVDALLFSNAAFLFVYVTVVTLILVGRHVPSIYFGMPIPTSPQFEEWKKLKDHAFNAMVTLANSRYEPTWRPSFDAPASHDNPEYVKERKKYAYHLTEITGPLRDDAFAAMDAARLPHLPKQKALLDRGLIDAHEYASQWVMYGQNG